MTGSDVADVPPERDPDLVALEAAEQELAALEVELEDADRPDPTGADPTEREQ